MKLITHNNLQQPTVSEVTRLLVEDIEGNPILIALEYAPGMILAAHAGDAEFNNLLKNLGIDKVVVCTDVKEKPADQVLFEGQ
jgi:hypothetical protein